MEPSPSGPNGSRDRIAREAPPPDPGEYLRALDEDLPPPLLHPEEGSPAWEKDEGLAERVLSHFAKNRPGPNSFPSQSLQILNLVADPHVEIGALARVVGRDPGLAAAVLKVANSALYRGASEVETVRDAITRLGLQEVARVAGMLSARTLFNPRAKAEFATFAPRWNALFHQSGTVAMAGAALAMRCRGARSDRVFLGGMLHDVGKSVALRSLAALVLDGEISLEPEDPIVDRVLDRVHLEIGGEVHQEWSLPNYLTMLAVRHHDGNIPADDEFLDIHVVRVVSAIYHLRTCLLHRGRTLEEAQESAKVLGLDRYRLRSVDAEVRDHSLRVTTMLGKDVAPMQTYGSPITGEHVLAAV